ncbi:hypothetical protein MDOR_11430 [Mycolicibacterium doricum]|uniref:Uncharacterized protein n=1 Tax=Mycolicibacterium doricum TaxID=126673 RepID=A0A7I7VNW2_9MYCO|nr:hypothetical protein [Mycolicibacterium doricum]MCV7268638.1 hypothetical protein [Mycolicibacterium doricum]BBZ06974.1 hypothetical protein MDOR_11430 [Mycolicibacterium doricum]
MFEANSGGDRSSRRPKRFLSPSQKYEIWLQLVRQEVTIAEAAAEHQVDRTTIMRIRTIAKEGALAALAASKPGVAARQRDYGLPCVFRTADFASIYAASCEFMYSMRTSCGVR